MSNNPQRLVNRFLAVSGIGRVQTAADVGLLNAEIDTRHACQITMEELVQRREQRDCTGRDLIGEQIRTRGLRFTFQYSEITPQIAALWAAYYFGASAAPTGTPANEVQALARTGTVSSGTFRLQLAHEGFTVKTRAIAYNATTAEIAAALTEARMVFLQPGDISVTGDWGTAMAIEFTGRMAGANLPLLTVENSTVGGGGSVGVTSTTNGEQLLHEVTRAVDDTKLRFSFALGWDDVTDRVEKYVGFVCESLQFTAEKRQAVGLTVSVVGPWEPEIETAFSIPECENITPLMTDDCRVQVNSTWETSDLNQLNYSLNDNVPLDETSAYPFAGIDVSKLERGDQPAYEITAGVFGSEEDALYTLALNERTQAAVDVKVHLGQPGNRFSLLSPSTKIKFQNNRIAFAGSLNESVIQIIGTPYATSPPVEAEAYISQAEAFLQESGT